ncbi:MAG: KH domain-containing protein [Candidatus Daviesbacteria bacterium]|nr:KH domain-containing protein [Candidatus Daviesbacteria bacterium]
MKDLLNFIVTNLVTKPEAVSVEEQKDNENINLNLTVDPTDMGLIIGKNGQTIRAIRKLLTVRAIAENIRVNLQLTEPVSPQEIATSADKSASSQ